MENVEKCDCDKKDISQENKCDYSLSSGASSSSSSTSSSPREKKPIISLTSLGLNLRRGKSKRKNLLNQIPSPTTNNETTKKTPKWNIKFNCTKKEQKPTLNQENCCKCKCLKQYNEDDMKNNDNIITVTAGSSDNLIVEENNNGLNEIVNENIDNLNTVDESTIATSSLTSSPISVVSDNNSLSNNAAVVDELQQDNNQDQVENVHGIYGTASHNNTVMIPAPFLDLNWMRQAHEDCDEAARLARAREIEQGVEAPANYRPLRRLEVLCSDLEGGAGGGGGQMLRRLHLVYPPDLSVDSLRALFHDGVTLRSSPLDGITGCHTQVDFIHYLVPDLLEITKCSFYWGKMDRYEAERLLDGKPEGTFLLRDSAQEEYLFSVSFRKYGRSLHARIEQWNHKFSFDCHDPGVFMSSTVCGLIEHYKDPSGCMFFEPVLTFPLHRNFAFSLQHLSRAVIVSRLTYDNINHLQLPKTLKSYLKEYHYRQKIRVERYDDEVQWVDLRLFHPS